MKNQSVQTPSSAELFEKLPQLLGDKLARLVTQEGQRIVGLEGFGCGLREVLNRLTAGTLQ